jgi:hypothetical protein
MLVRFLCATRLHNFCINEKLLSSDSSDDDDSDDSDEEDDDDDDAPPQHRVQAATGSPTDNDGFLPSSVDVVTVQGNSMMRDLLVDKISSEALSRPAHNVVRNVVRTNQEKNNE